MARRVSIASSDAPGGAALLVVAAVLWSLNGFFIRYLNNAGVDGWSIAGYRSLFAGLALTPFALRRVGPIGQWWWPLAAVLAFTAMCATFVHSMTRTTVANAIVLQYTAPAWVFVLAPWITGERASRRQLASLAFALAGVVVIFAGQFDMARGGLLLGLASGLVFGVQTVLFRKSRAVHPLVLTWLACGGSALLLLAMGGAAGVLAVSASALGWLAVMGVAQFAVPYILYSIGLGRMSAQKGSMLILVEPVLSPLWVYLAFGEVPQGSTMLGGAFIISSVVLVTLLDRRERLLHAKRQ